MSFNFSVVFNFNVFPFPPSKAKFLGDVPVNKQNAGNGSSQFFIFVFCEMDGTVSGTEYRLRGKMEMAREMEMGRERCRDGETEIAARMEIERLRNLDKNDRWVFFFLRQ